MKGMPKENKLSAVRMILGPSNGGPAPARGPSPSPGGQAELERVRHVDANQGASMHLGAEAAEANRYNQAMAAGDYQTAKGIAMENFRQRWGLKR